jgi:hypothetical protein
MSEKRGFDEVTVSDVINNIHLENLQQELDAHPKKRWKRENG